MSMGIYLPNMEMPENCICCDLSHEDGWCPAKQTYTDIYTFKTCPLIPVPLHGDLIDRREAIIDANERAYDFWLSDDEVNATIQFLKEQPTIIPAEEGE